MYDRTQTRKEKKQKKKKSVYYDSYIFLLQGRVKRKKNLYSQEKEKRERKKILRSRIANILFFLNEANGGHEKEKNILARSPSLSLSPIV